MSICKLEAGEETVITIHVVIGNVEKNLPLSKSAAKAGATDMPAATTAAPNALGTLNLKPAATAYKRKKKNGKKNSIRRVASRYTNHASFVIILRRWNAIFSQ